MSYFDLGRYGRPVTTTSSEAQTWFDRGLVWTYGFNHEEAVACFERAVAEDPDCAMAHWGIAYALGPNYNKPWEFFDAADLRTTVERTHDAIGRALSLADRVTPVERGARRGPGAPLPDGGGRRRGRRRLLGVERRVRGGDVAGVPTVRGRRGRP